MAQDDPPASDPPEWCETMPTPSTPPQSTTPVRGTRQTSEAVRQACINVAVFDGVKWGTIAAVASGGAVLLANRSSRAFRSYLGLSGKIACVMIPTSGAFFLSSELTLLAAQRDPSAFGIVLPAQPVLPARSASEAAAEAEAAAAMRAVVAAAEEKETQRREAVAEKAAAGGGDEGKDLKKETSVSSLESRARPPPHSTTTAAAAAAAATTIPPRHPPPPLPPRRRRQHHHHHRPRRRLHRPCQLYPRTPARRTSFRGSS